MNLPPPQIAAVHHGLMLLIERSQERIDELTKQGSEHTAIASYWYAQLDDARQALKTLGICG